MTLDELATFVASACSLTVGTDLFRGALPAKDPDECAALIEYGGRPPDVFLGASGVGVEYPRVQLVFRGAKDDWRSPRETAELAYRAAVAAGAQAIDGTRYLALLPLQPPFLLKRDESQRPIVAFNVELQKELSAA